MAEEVKITKEKIKEVEEEWQSNLLNWKSKRRVNHNSTDNEGSTGDEDSNDGKGRKIKTFSEILNEKAKSGHRIGYNLHRYGYEAEEDDDISSLIRSTTTDNHHSNNDSEFLNLLFVAPLLRDSIAFLNNFEMAIFFCWSFSSQTLV